MDLKKIDKGISAISRDLNFYSYLTPLNQDDQREKFFSSLEKGKVYNPVYQYRETGKDLQQKLKSLMEMEAELSWDKDLEVLFLKKICFLEKQIELLAGNDESFGSMSKELFGFPDNQTLELAEGILRTSKEENYIFPEETVTPGQMVSIMTEELKEENLDWQVKLSDKIIPKITVSGTDRTLYINSSINYTKEEVKRLKVHEVKVHIFRGANGARQGYNIFAEGLSGYEPTEEGLAIYAEELLGCLDVDTRQRKLYAGRAISTNVCYKNDFYNSFMDLRGFFPDYIAYRLIERAKRGLVDTSKAGALTKGFHYISGYRNVKAFVEDGEDLGILYVGKVSLEDIDVIRSLLNKGVLQSPKYLPDFIKKNE